MQDEVSISRFAPAESKLFMVGSLRKLAGLLIVAVGIVAAIPFQRPSPPVAAPRAEVGVVWRSPDATLDVTVPIRKDPLGKPARRAAVRVVPQIRASSGHTPVSMSPAFEGIRAGGSAQMSPATQPDTQSQSSPAARLLPGGSVPAVRDGEIERRHAIADGDQLKALALRYLGSEQRWREIYDANRDLLKDPARLPVGAELRIPLRRPTP